MRHLFEIDTNKGDAIEISLTRNQKFLFGRLGSSDYEITDSRISDIHATLVVNEDGAALLFDGDGDTPSRGGIFDRYGKPVDRYIPLELGVAVYVCYFKDLQVILTYCARQDDACPYSHDPTEDLYSAQNTTNEALRRVSRGQKALLFNEMKGQKALSEEIQLLKRQVAKIWDGQKEIRSQLGRQKRTDKAQSVLLAIALVMIVSLGVARATDPSMQHSRDRWMAVVQETTLLFSATLIPLIVSRSRKKDEGNTED